MPVVSIYFGVLSWFTKFAEFSYIHLGKTRLYHALNLSPCIILHETRSSNHTGFPSFSRTHEVICFLFTWIQRYKFCESKFNPFRIHFYSAQSEIPSWKDSSGLWNSHQCSALWYETFSQCRNLLSKNNGRISPLFWDSFKSLFWIPLLAFTVGYAYFREDNH